MLRIDNGNGRGHYTFTPLSRPQPQMAYPFVAYGNMYGKHDFVNGTVSSNGTARTPLRRLAGRSNVIVHSNAIQTEGSGNVDASQVVRVPPPYPAGPADLRQPPGSGTISGWTETTSTPPGAVHLGQRMWWEFADGSYGKGAHACNTSPGAAIPCFGVTVRWGQGTTLASGGNRGAALKVYERCRRALAQELGIGPSPHTEAAYLAILRNEQGERGPRSVGGAP